MNDDEAQGKATHDALLAERAALVERLEKLCEVAAWMAEAVARPRFRPDGWQLIHWKKRCEIFMTATRGWQPSNLQNSLWVGLLWGLQQPRYGRFARFSLINAVRFDGEQVWDHTMVFRDPLIKRRTSGIFSAPYGHVDLGRCLASDDAKRFCDTFHVKFVTDFGFEYALDAQPFLVVADEERGPPDATKWRTTP